jgi:hypothetical protein
MTSFQLNASSSDRVNDYSCHEDRLLSLQRLNSIYSKPAKYISELQRYDASYFKMGVLEKPS